MVDAATGSAMSTRVAPRKARRLTGRVECYDARTRFGRVVADGRLYVFVASDVEPGVIPRPGATVVFIPTETLHGRFARNITDGWPPCRKCGAPVDDVCGACGTPA
jgi:hypothetical protein